MEDIAPELYKKIEAEYTSAVKNDRVITNIAGKLNKRPLTHNELTTVSTRLGQHASDALKDVLTPEALPDGRLYWNIADRTIRPVLTQVYDTENALLTMSKRLQDKAAGINIGIVKGADPAKHIDEVIDFATNSGTAEELSNALNLPVKTTALDYYDDFLDENCKAREALGFKQVITREYDGVGLGGGKYQCSWCLGRAGTYYSYQEAYDAGAFERHTGCGCSIDVTEDPEVDNEEFTTNTAVPF